MAADSDHDRPTFTFAFEGNDVQAVAGDTVAEALWRAGVQRLSRSPKYHRPRGAFCFAGHCGTCLMRIAGRPNVRACQTVAIPDLTCERQNAFPDADVDVLRAADWLFPHGMDHHHLMTGTKVGNSLFVKLVRQMGGTGVLPEGPEDRFLGTGTSRRVDVAVVGAGPAGLAAAIAVREVAAHASVLVIDARPMLGGSWLAEPEGLAQAARLEASARAAGVQLWPGSAAFGHYAEDGDTREDHVVGVLAVLRPSGLALVSAGRFVWATGTYEQNLPFVGNDRPGVVAARALGRLLFARKLPAPKRLQVIEDPALSFSYGDTLRAAASACGVQVQTLSLSEAEHAKPSRSCVVAVAALPAPAFELPRQQGVPVKMRLEAGGFCPESSPNGQTPVANVFVAGDVTGYMGPQKAETHGRLVGRTVGSQV